MEHSFYNKTKKQQNKIQLTIAILAAGVVLLSCLLTWISGLFFISLFTFAVVVSIVAPFFDTPAMRKRGKLIYYSPMLIAEKPKDGKIIIHGGTLFDYYFVIDRRMSVKERTNFIIQQYLQGLLDLIEAYENSEQNDLTIRGTSYIFNKRTAEKIGFTAIKTDVTQMIILVFNYFNILLSNSIAKKRLSFPNLSNSKTFETNLTQLLEQKHYIAKLNNKLKKQH